MLSASHNPAGLLGDFGIKINGSNGSPLSDKQNNAIYEETLKIAEFSTIDNFEVNVSTLNAVNVINTEIEIFDGVIDYANKMEEIFDFPAIKGLLENGYKAVFNGFNGATGIFAEEIFGRRLGVDKKYLLNTESLEDFGGLVPDPNPSSAKDYTEYMKNLPEVSLGLACDADGDRNMLFSKKYNLEPSDSIAVILKYAHLVNYYNGKIYGVARSRPTPNAVDLVAEKLGVACYCVPVGWKFFGSLLEAKKITFCAEESYGTGSNHSGEKDGIWALLFWLHIIAKSQKTFDEILEDLWTEYGRVYFSRLDFENLEELHARKLLRNFEDKAIGNIGRNFFGSYTVEAVENFSYTDIITGQSVGNLGLIVKFNSGAEVMVRTSGTGTQGITIRMYVSKYEKDKVFLEKGAYLADFLEALYNLIGENVKPTFIV
jgi:phosphoglucomutase